MVYGASWLLQLLSLLILTNLDKSSHLCWARFAPRAQVMFVSLQSRVHPIQLTLFRCLHISLLPTFPCPPYNTARAQQCWIQLRRWGPNACSRCGHTALSFAWWMLVRSKEARKIHYRHPWVWRQPPPQPISICKTLEGTVQVGGRAQARPFWSTMGGILLSCANCLCNLGGHKPKPLLWKPSPAPPQPCAQAVAELQAAGADGDRCQWCCSTRWQLPMALTGERLPCVHAAMAVTGLNNCREITVKKCLRSCPWHLH